PIPRRPGGRAPPGARDSAAFERAIDTQVSRIRQKLRASTDSEVIRTLRGEGYMFMPPVTLIAADEVARAARPTPAPPAAAVIRIDPNAYEASIGGRPLELTFSEFTLLAILLEDEGTVVSKDALCRQVLGRPWRSFDRSIDVHVSNLRNKLAPYPAIVIETVRRVGYRLVAG
ncbi:MAG: winged helix-turn-helix domain-containing protein, partial [Sphingomonas sp.]